MKSLPSLARSPWIKKTAEVRFARPLKRPGLGKTL
jgi:hypothetical protein